jgi:HK97 family phage prohead protease
VINRAYSLITIKSVSDDAREITGIATTPSTDKTGDIVEPGGASFTLPMPLLWQHDAHQPIGHVTHAKVTDHGIEIKARLVRIDEPGSLKDRLDEAWHSVKSGLVRGLSIGFRSIETEPIKSTGGLRFIKWAWHELSAVTIPANSDASILAIKALDAPFLAPTGTGDAVSSVTPPAVVGRAPVKLHKGSSPVAQTYTEQIKNFENTRAANVARMDAIQQAAAARGEGKTDAEREEFDTLRDQLKGIDQELVDLRELEKAVALKPVAAASPVAASAARDTNSPLITVKQDLPPGIGLARYTMAQIQARKEYRNITEVVKERWPSDGRLHAFVTKASVPPGMTTVEAWAGAIAEPTNLSSEFVEYLRPRTIVGRIPGLKRVPFNVRYMGQNSGAVAQWVGQGKGKPVTSFGVFDGTLLRTKIAAIAVITEELARDSRLEPGGRDAGPRRAGPCGYRAPGRGLHRSGPGRGRWCQPGVDHQRRHGAFAVGYHGRFRPCGPDHPALAVRRAEREPGEPRPDHAEHPGARVEPHGEQPRTGVVPRHHPGRRHAARHPGRGLAVCGQRLGLGQPRDRAERLGHLPCR